MQIIESHLSVAIIGLGYVGLPLAVEFGKKRSVVDFDINAKRIAELKNSHDHTPLIKASESVSKVLTPSDIVIHESMV